MEIRLTLKSDATFGRGDGLIGLIDTEVEHDPDTGLPFLRGRTLKGLLVEECSGLLYALVRQGSDALPALEEAAQFLFGAPGSTAGAEAQMRPGRARLPEDVRTAVAADVRAGRLDPADVLDALTGIRRQTAIDDATGAPAPGSLRSARTVLRKTPFHARLRFTRAPAPAAKALLAACVQSVRRAGMRRNRGRGRLDARLYEDGGEVTDEHFERFGKIVRGEAAPSQARPSEPETTSLDAERAGEPSAPGGGARSTGGPVTLTYRIRLDQPALVTALGGDPNSATAFDYLPGSALRGALVSAYMRRRGLPRDHDLADNDEARRLFFDGAVRFLNGYPTSGEDGGRTLPTPRSYHRPKGDDGSARDFTAAPPAPDSQTQWKALGKPFAQRENGTLRLFQPERYVATHNRRDRKKGRATAHSGEIFRYDALAAGQVFEAALLCPDAGSAGELEPLLEEIREEGTLVVGGSRAGYGGAEITGVRRRPGGDWRERPGRGTPRLSDDGTFAVTLMSNALVRDGSGQFTASAGAVTGAMREYLGVEKLRRTAKGTFTSAEVVGGFNRKWGLPLPQARSVEMGSVLAFRIPDFDDFDSDARSDVERRLAELEWEGIGERRAEGFGRVAVNAPDAEGETDVKTGAVEAGASDTSRRSIEDDAARRVAEAMAERMLRKRLDVALVKKVNALVQAAGAISHASNSQLGRLRQAFRGALEAGREDGRAPLVEFLRTLPGNARSQLRRDRLEGTSLLDWLKHRAKEEGERDIQDALDISDPDLPQVGQNVEADLSGDLAYEYSLRLAHDTLARASTLDE